MSELILETVIKKKSDLAKDVMQVHCMTKVNIKNIPRQISYKKKFKGHAAMTHNVYSIHCYGLFAVTGFT